VSEAIPLSAEDRAILELEGPTVAGHTCKVVQVGGPGLGVDAVRERIAERIDREPLLRYRLGESGAAPAWVPDPEFAVERHIVAAEGEAGADPARLAAELFEQRLDRDRPLWRIDVAPLATGGTALIWRRHHALADGTTAMRLARQLLWDEEPSEGQPGPQPGRTSPHRPTRAQAEDHDRRRDHLGAFLRREFADSLRPSPFDGEIGARRTIAFTSLPFAPLHDAAKEICGATVNDAVLAVVAGAVRRWVEHHHGALGAVRFRVPVSLHHEGDDAGNRDSFFTLPVHLDEPDPIARLRAIHAASAERKTDHDAERIESLLGSLESHAPPLAGLAKRLEESPRSFALCVSNVPGPRRALAMLGTPVRSLHSVAEVGQRHGLRVAVVSYAGDLGFGLCADPAIADDLEAMAAGIEAEAEVFLRAARS